MKLSDNQLFMKKEMAAKKQWIIAEIACAI